MVWSSSSNGAMTETEGAEHAESEAVKSILRLTKYNMERTVDWMVPWVGMCAVNISYCFIIIAKQKIGNAEPWFYNNGGKVYNNIVFENLPPPQLNLESCQQKRSKKQTPPQKGKQVFSMIQTKQSITNQH